MKACVKKSISLAWFYKSTLHINLAENGAIHKIFHPTETHKNFWEMTQTYKQCFIVINFYKLINLHKLFHINFLI